MPSLSAYVNTENTALAILAQKGFRTWGDEAACLYYAEKEGWDFAGASFVELLGTVAIYEFIAPSVYKEYWWKIDEPWLLDSVPKQAPDYTPVWKKRDPKQAD